MINRLGFFVAVALVMTAGCNEGDNSETDVVEDVGTDTSGQDEGTVADVAANACHSCLAPGQTFLFRTLDVTEPASPVELPNLLNEIWAPDILEYRLNIMIKIEEVIPQDGGTIKLRCGAASAWHNLSFEEVRTLGSTRVPDTFHFTVSELVKDLWFSVDQNCDFTSLNDPDSGVLPGIDFRPGTVEKYLLCSAGNDEIDLPANTVPIRGLTAHGHFDGTCQHIENAELSGCIAKNATCELCNMVTAPDYDLWESVSPDPSVTPVVCEAAYCEHHCGAMPWVNFGGFVSGIGVPLNCDLDNDGVCEGFRLTAGFNADSVVYAEPAE